MHKIKEQYMDYDLSDKINCRMIDKSKPVTLLRPSPFARGGDHEVIYNTTDGLVCGGFMDKDMLEEVEDEKVSS